MTDPALPFRTAGEITAAAMDALQQLFSKDGSTWQNLRNWGMMDVQGKWRIDPCYDKPFHFDAGRAHVWYKGIPGSIDETGRFLPDPPDDPALFPAPSELGKDQ